MAPTPMFNLKYWALATAKHLARCAEGKDMLLLSLFSLSNTYSTSQEKMLFFKNELVLHCRINLL